MKCFVLWNVAKASSSEYVFKKIGVSHILLTGGKLLIAGIYEHTGIPLKTDYKGL
jgi:hypothetical protein